MTTNLKQLRELCDAATQGDEDKTNELHDTVLDFVPALIDEVERLRGALEYIRDGHPILGSQDSIKTSIIMRKTAIQALKGQDDDNL